MRHLRLLLTIALGTTLLAAVMACGEDEGVDTTITADDAGSTVSIDAGTTLRVELAGNPSTGYGWEVAGVDNTILTQTGEPAFTPESDAVGAPGTVVLRFEAAAPGTTPLEFVYRRPFEEGVPPTDTFSVTVTVE